MPTIIAPEAIRKARTKADLTQTEVALRLNVTQSLISQYESGVITPPSSMLAKLADLYGVRPGSFFKQAPATAAA